ncbi:MAG: hypothetical protein PVF11_17080, partial [Desulfobacterales bacterium]
LARQVSGAQKQLDHSTPRIANRRRRCRKSLLPGTPAAIFFLLQEFCLYGQTDGFVNEWPNVVA